MVCIIVDNTYSMENILPEIKKVLEGLRGAQIRWYTLNREIREIASPSSIEIGEGIPNGETYKGLSQIPEGATTILISDGFVYLPPSHILESIGPISTVGIGRPLNPVSLKKIAEATRGKYVAATTKNLGIVLEKLIKNREKVHLAYSVSEKADLSVSQIWGRIFGNVTLGLVVIGVMPRIVKEIVRAVYEVLLHLPLKISALIIISIWMVVNSVVESLMRYEPRRVKREVSKQVTEPLPESEREEAERRIVGFVKGLWSKEVIPTESELCRDLEESCMERLRNEFGGVLKERDMAKCMKEAESRLASFATLKAAAKAMILRSSVLKKSNPCIVNVTPIGTPLERIISDILTATKGELITATYLFIDSEGHYQRFIDEGVQREKKKCVVVTPIVEDKMLAPAMKYISSLWKIEEVLGIVNLSKEEKWKIDGREVEVLCLF
jgi:hypothetical protein